MTPPVNGNSALFLDIDGTLLDLARAPDAVVVPDGLASALALLSEELRGALAFVSGRSLAAIDRLFAPLMTAAVGCHGAEVRGSDGAVFILAQPLPDSIRHVFRILADGHPGTILEDKTYALALHYRLAPEARPDLLRAVEGHAAIFAAEKISILYGNAVIEARPLGVDKALGVRALLRQKPFQGRRLVFGGDDTTDMDVFRVLPELGGHGFSVGKPFPGVEHVFESPHAVRQWLACLARQGVVA